MYERHITGQDGENDATKYLQSKGYTIVERNFYCKQGEIDIIAIDVEKNEYVFIEVKSRTNYEYGSPIEAVTTQKQKHIVSATQYYIYKNNLENKFIRFDVITIYKRKNNSLQKLRIQMEVGSDNIFSPKQT